MGIPSRNDLVSLLNEKKNVSIQKYKRMNESSIRIFTVISIVVFDAIGVLELY